MILGVDHLALPCEDLAQGVKLLEDAGYRAKFIHENVPNPPEKRAFLRSYEMFHSLAYCQAEGSVSLELTRHSGPLAQGVSPYQVLLKGAPPGAAPWAPALPASWEEAWHRALSCRRPAPGWWPALQAQFWYDAEPASQSSRSVPALLIPVKDLPLSESFWVQGLGSRLIQRSMDRGNKWVHLAYKAPVPAWRLDLVLVEDEAPRPLTFLDDPGFPCLALISSDLSRDAQAAREAGSSMRSEDFVMKVGGKALKIIILRGPDHELVEMIQFVGN